MIKCQKFLRFFCCLRFFFSTATFFPCDFQGDEAAKKTPLNAQEARAKAIGQPPAPCMLQLRNQEHCAIVPKEDRIIVILAIQMDDEQDVALGRAFCQEFAETNRSMG